MINNSNTVPDIEVDTLPNKEEVSRAFGAFGDEKEPNPQSQLKEAVSEYIKSNNPESGVEADKFIKSEEVDNTFEEANKDNKFVSYVKEKLPDTYGECKNLSEIAKTTIKEAGKISWMVTKEYYSLQLVVGGGMILATGLGGPIGKVVGSSLMRVGYKYSRLLNSNFEEKDLEDIVNLYKDSNKEKK